jgi:hypothetical protein
MGRAKVASIRPAEAGARAPAGSAQQQSLRSSVNRRAQVLGQRDMHRVRERPIQQHRVRDGWANARAKAGVPDWATPHDLRHYFANVLIRSGASVKVVQARLGHSSAKTTLDVYGHLFADEEDRTRAAIDAEFGSPCAPEGSPGHISRGQRGCEVRYRSRGSHIEADFVTCDNAGKVPLTCSYSCPSMTAIYPF